MQFVQLKKIHVLGKDGFLTVSSKDKTVLPGDDPICPKCGRSLYRVGVEYRLDLSVDQTPPLVEGVDYQTSEVVYDTES